MNAKLTVSAALAASILFLGGCATQQKGATEPATQASGPAEPPSRMGWETFRESTDPDVILAGMPSEEALDIFKARGGTMVINLRTDEEMQPFPGYEQGVEARGLTYVQVPTSGSTMSGETYAPVAKALDAADGPVLLHCASGGRATYVWAMRRMDREGLTADQAVAWAAERQGKVWERGAVVLAEFESGGQDD